MGALLSLFANNLLPVFLAAGAGFVLGKVVRIEAQALSRVAFYVFSPCLVFTLLTANELGNGEVLQMAAFAVAQMALVGLLAWGVAKGLRFERRLLVAVVLTALLPNAGNYGLAVNLFAFGEEGLAYASLYFIVSAVVASTAGVYIASLGRAGYREALAGLLKIPTIYAVVLAGFFIGFGWILPVGVSRTVEIFSDAAIPTMLVLLGLQLGRAKWKGMGSGVAVANGLRLVISPLLALGLSALFGLQGLMRQAGVLESAMPTAVMATVLATEFEVEPEFVTAVVFSSTLLSPLTVTPLLAYLGG